MRVTELAKYLQAEIHVPTGHAGERDPELAGLAPIEHAGPKHATFVASQEFAKHATTTGAAVVITAAVLPDCPRLQILHKNPYWAFARTAQLFYKPDHGPIGVSPQAYVASDARLGARVTVHPFAYIGSKAQIGDDCVVYPFAYVGPGVVLGDETVVRPSAVLEHGTRVGKRGLIHGAAVIGGDGFGFAPGEGGIAKIPQVGGVVLGDDVEIGPGATVDRGAMDDTRIGDNTKLDSQTHVAHGVKIGSNTMLCGQSGIAGSAKVGDWVVLGGACSVDNRVEIASGIQVGAKSGVTKDLTEKGVYLGFPAQPIGEWRRQTVLARRLPQLEDRIKGLEKRLKELETKG